KQDCDRMKADRIAPAGLPDSEIQWQLVGADPARYLSASAAQEKIVRPFGRLGSGSCFAISREGILLTNRHVIEDTKDKQVDCEEVACLAPDCLGQLVRSLLTKLGELPKSEKDRSKIQTNLFEWTGKKCRRSTRVKGALVALAYADPKPGYIDPVAVAANQF